MEETNRQKKTRAERKRRTLLPMIRIEEFNANFVESEIEMACAKVKVERMSERRESREIITTNVIKFSRNIIVCVCVCM